MVWFGMNLYLGSICLNGENCSLIMIGLYIYLLAPMSDVFRTCCDLMFKVIQQLKCANWHINTNYPSTGHLHRVVMIIPVYYNRMKCMVQKKDKYNIIIELNKDITIGKTTWFKEIIRYWSNTKKCMLVQKVSNHYSKIWWIICVIWIFL